jgi:hypothetical protein
MTKNTAMAELNQLVLLILLIKGRKLSFFLLLPSEGFLPILTNETFSFIEKMDVVTLM